MFNILGSLVNTQPNLFITATSGTGESSRCRESAFIGRLGWNIIVKKSKSMDCPSESKTLTLQRGGGGGASIWKQLFQFSCESQPRAIPIGWDFPPYPLGSGVANNSEVSLSFSLAKLTVSYTYFTLQLTYADITFFDLMNLFSSGEPTVPEPLEKFPLLVDLYKRVLEDPGIKAWVEKRPKTDHWTSRGHWT